MPICLPTVLPCALRSMQQLHAAPAACIHLVAQQWPAGVTNPWLSGPPCKAGTSDATVSRQSSSSSSSSSSSISAVSWFLYQPKLPGTLQHSHWQHQQHIVGCVTASGHRGFSTAGPDAFTASLQSKTEQEVLSLLQNARDAQLAKAAADLAATKAAAAAGDSGSQADAGGAGAEASGVASGAVQQQQDQQYQQQQAEAEAEAEAEDDTEDLINPETGEVYGPRGKEPTRYGDWEIKGRCTDFS